MVDYYCTTQGYFNRDLRVVKNKLQWGESHTCGRLRSSLSQLRDALLDGWGRLVGVNVTNTLRWKCWSPGTRRELMRQMQRPRTELCTPLINLTSICVEVMSPGTSPATEADFALMAHRLPRLHLEGHQESPLGLWFQLQYSSCPGLGQKLQRDPTPGAL